MAAPFDRCKQVLLTRVLVLLAVVPCLNISAEGNILLTEHPHTSPLSPPALIDLQQPVNSIFVYMNEMVPTHRCCCALDLTVAKDRSDCKRSLLLSSGVEPNPGPRRPKYPCGICKKACKGGQPCIACDDCDKWVHKTCLGMSTTE